MSRARFAEILGTAFLAILFFGCERKPGEKLYQEALSEWEQGHHVRARALMEKSIRRQAGSQTKASAQNQLGLLLWEMGEIDPAASAFQESCRIDAEDYGALYNLGVALSKQNNFPEAERAFREAALLNPNDARPLAFAGIAYLHNQNWNDAERNLKLALTRSPKDPQLDSFIALVELHTQGVQQALQRFQRITTEHPDYAPGWFNLASIQLHYLKNQTAARTLFERYLEKSDGSDSISAFARTYLQRINEPTPTPSLDLQLTGKTDRAQAEQEFQKALALHRSGDLEAAIKGYKRSIQEDNTYAYAYYNLGLTYYAVGTMPLAGEAFSQAVTLNPAFTEARYNGALVDYYHLKNPERAQRELNAVLSQTPDYQPAIDLLARILADVSE